MNPRAAAKDAAKIDTRSPFEQITQLENDQESRVRQSVEAFDAEQRDAQKTMTQAEKTQEEQYRERAREELREFAKKEPAAILQQNEEDTAEQLKTITKQYQKNAPKTVESLVSAVLDLSI